MVPVASEMIKMWSS